MGDIRVMYLIVLYTLRQENIGPVNKSSAVFAKYLSNHLGYREVIYIIGKL